MKRQLTEWDKIVVNYVTDTCDLILSDHKIISKIYKQHMMLNSIKTNKWDLIKFKSFRTAKKNAWPFSEATGTVSCRFPGLPLH